MTRLRRAGRQTFRALAARNFRLYFFGQIVSASGSWMQQIAQIWLVLELTRNGVLVGLTTALQFLPVLAFGAWAGVLVDRVDKRRILITTASVSTVLAGTLGALTLSGAVELWMVYAMAFLLGCVTAVESPARRAFVTELVALDHEGNALVLNTSAFTAARLFGPALAGIVIAAVGVAWCFFLNAVSFLPVIGAYLLMRKLEMRPTLPIPRTKGQLREGFAYVWTTPTLRVMLLMIAVIGTLSYNFQVVLSLLVEQTFHHGASGFGLLYSLMSAGALVGSLLVAHRDGSGERFVAVAAVLFGITMTASAFAPTLVTAGVILVVVGVASTAFQTAGNALAQLVADPKFRGRVAALFAVAFLGSTPIGGPLVGWICQQFGARAGLLVGGVTALATGLWALSAISRHHPQIDEPSGSVSVVAHV